MENMLRDELSEKYQEVKEMREEIIVREKERRKEQ